MTQRSLARTFWIGAAAILVAAALVALFALLRGDFSDTDGRILLTLGALLYSGGVAIAGLALADRGPARRLGWVVVGAAPIGVALMLAAIWSFVWEEDNEPWARLAWSSVIALLAGLLATTSLLLTRRPLLTRLSAAAGVLATLAATLSITGIWAEQDSDAYAKAVGAMWIVTALAYFLVPVLQRFTAAAVPETESRVLAELDGVELVATRSAEGALDARLDPGERLVLRRRG